LIAGSFPNDRGHHSERRRAVGSRRRRTLTERAERAEAMLREREHRDIVEAEQRRVEEQTRRQALAEAEARRLHDEEVESTRQGTWFLALTNPADLEVFKKCADDGFDPAKIRARIPSSGWPENDGPEYHTFVHPAPTGSGTVPALSGDDEPELVKQARARGIQF
jgi:hypothetical protein